MTAKEATEKALWCTHVWGVDKNSAYFACKNCIFKAMQEFEQALEAAYREES